MRNLYSRAYIAFLKSTVTRLKRSFDRVALKILPGEICTDIVINYQ